jgi:hypothetical protein
VLSRIFNVPAHLQALPTFAEVDAEPIQLLQDDAGKFVGEMIPPLYLDGDEIGAQCAKGTMTMPPGLKDADQSVWQSDWSALASSTENAYISPFSCLKTTA